MAIPALLVLFCLYAEDDVTHNVSVQGPVSRSLPWKGPPLVKEGSFFSFGKATLKFSFTKPPLNLLTKGLP